MSVEDIIEISESDLIEFFKCRYSFYLSNFRGLNKIPMISSTVASITFSNKRREIFNVRDPKIGQLFPNQRRAGPDSKDITQMTAEEFQTYSKFSSPESFGKYVRRIWLYTVENNTYGERQIAWRYITKENGEYHPNAKAEKGALGYRLKLAATNYYQFILDNIEDSGFPVIEFINRQRTFDFLNYRITTTLADTRPGYVEDPSIWTFQEEKEEHKVDIEENKKIFDQSPRITLKLLAYCSLAHDYDPFRRKWGIPDDVADSWGGNEMYIDPAITFRHLNLKEGNDWETYRSDENLELLMNYLNIIADETPDLRDYPTNTKSCGSCKYNVIDHTGERICPKGKGKAAMVAVY